MRRFSVNPRRVVHETIDGETILIALDSGCYYSVAGAGAEIFELIGAGYTADELAEAMSSRYPAEAAQAAQAARELLDDLLREGLLDDAEDGAAAVAPPEREPAGEFEPPALKRYTDMQYFLMLDPVHEADDAGWPHERPADEAPAVSAD